MIKESKGILIHSEDRQLAHWARDFREEFICLRAKVDLPLMPEKETMQVDSNPPSETEVIRGIKHLDQMDFLRPYSRTVAKC